MSIAYLLLLLFFLLVVVLVFLYNRLVKQQLLVKEGWSGIGTYLQQRNDLIPNLVETVKGSTLHESSTLRTIVECRNQVQESRLPGDQIKASNQLNTALNNFFAIAEAYPDLKANQNFLQLQQDLGEVESNLNQSRRYYNATVRNFNASVAVFPSNLVAGLFQFQPAPFFEESDEAKTVPPIRFGA